jgi:hypothetical protein
MSLFDDHSSYGTVCEIAKLTKIIITCAFLLSIHSFMKYRSAFDIKVYLTVYNTTQVLLCMYFIINFFHTGYKIDFLWKCYLPGYENLNHAKLIYFIYFVKAIEFTETICFLLKKNFRQASFLHIYHHTSTVIFTYLSVTQAASNSFSI